ncbi:MAG: hypothetical protein ACEPOZ_05080 [Marinifilaceae bacterium]
MRRITRNNYEEFFLDYLEGNLDGPDLFALKFFLDENPDLDSELQEMQLISVEPGDDRMEGKDFLKKSRFDEGFEDFCIARMEGDLEEEEACEFENYLRERDEKYHEARVFEKLRLEADSSLVCPDKKHLERRTRILSLPQIYSGMAVAASILLAWGIWMHRDNGNEMPAQIAGSISNPVVKKSETLVRPATAEVRSINKNIKVVVPPKQVPTIPEFTSTRNRRTEPGQTQLVVEEAAEKLLAVIERVPVLEIPEVGMKAVEITPVQTFSDRRLQNLSVYDDQDYMAENTHSDLNGLEEAGLVWKQSDFEEEEEVAERKVNLLKIAGKGLAGLGRLAGKTINLEKNYDPETDRTRIAFNTFGIGFSKSKKVR